MKHEVVFCSIQITVDDAFFSKYILLTFLRLNTEADGQRL